MDGLLAGFGLPIKAFISYVPNESKKIKYAGPEEQSSWNKASYLCTYIGGILPMFFNKAELDDFMALAKLSSEIPPIEGIFIGLKFSNKTQVMVHIF